MLCSYKSSIFFKTLDLVSSGKIGIQNIGTIFAGNIMKLASKVVFFTLANEDEVTRCENHFS